METEDRPVVVGIDGSPESRTALRWAAAEARRWGAPLVVVHAWEPTLGQALVPVDEASVEHHAQAARHTLDHVIELEAEALAGLRVDRRLVRAGPAPALLDEADDALMLVVGARGHGGFQKLLLGSVSQQCIHYATCPVVVVR
jgi:nucleotide-binding universal stress UspA family protein